MRCPDCREESIAIAEIREAAIVRDTPAWTNSAFEWRKRTGAERATSDEECHLP